MQNWTRSDITRATVIILCLSLAFSLSAYGQNFPKGIKYLGGPGFPDKKEVRKSWGNSLYISKREIIFIFRNNAIPTEGVPISSVARLTYGQATTRRVGKWIAVGIIFAPIALFGILHKSRQHRILVEWTDDQKRDRGILMQIHKKQFIAVLNALTFRTGKLIYANRKDRDWLFRNGVKAELEDEGADKPKNNENK